jgi:uncharacterized protein with PIN domain
LVKKFQVKRIQSLLTMFAKVPKGLVSLLQMLYSCNLCGQIFWEFFHTFS